MGNTSSQQQQQVAQTNQLIQQSQQSLICGPGTQCAKDKETELLKKQYDDAKDNLQMAPQKLAETEKKYILFSQGNAAYGDFEKNKLTVEADKQAAQMKQEFEGNIHNIQKLNTTLDELIIHKQNIQDLHEMYFRKNKTLKKQIGNRVSDVAASDRKTYYENENYDGLMSWYKIWSRLYILLVVVFTLGLFVVPNELTRWKKAGCILFLIIYPFIIDKIVAAFLIAKLSSCILSK